MRYRAKVEVGRSGRIDYTPYRRWKWIVRWDIELYALAEARETLFTIESKP